MRRKTEKISFRIATHHKKIIEKYDGDKLVDKFENILDDFLLKGEKIKKETKERELQLKKLCETISQKKDILQKLEMVEIKVDGLLKSIN
jgi:hypothetical protein